MHEIRRLVQQALHEDIGLGDLTTMATIGPGTQARAELVAKEDFVLAGIDVAREVFRQLDA
ncbi:MAG: nicotinate-nucleotide diphosphorylase (carboxylating), partial [Deltaproteobacteria bacterium]